MKQVLSITALVVLFALNAKAQVESNELTTLQKEVSELQTNQNRLKSDVITLTSKNKNAESRIAELEKSNHVLHIKIDSLQNENTRLANNQKTDKSELSSSISQTNEKVQATEDILSSRTLWGVCGIIAIIIALIATVWSFLKKFKSGSSSIDGVIKAQESLEKAQESIRKAQEKMQEESIKLDNQLLAVASQQIATATQKPIGNDAEPDHSLAKKVADEIVRIELNLSRMDSSIKGHKQLAKAVQRIKDNFNANGYEIVDMLGRPYDAGMRVIASFVSDENLKMGEQIITGITKPQINFNGQMIQAAQITVSQNI